MDYVVGSVAALVTGNVTPNRPKFMKRALTPIKHQPSPNVTPKSELVEDRSIFLSPTLQKKKAIVKKSPKRIFENPDLDVSNDGEGNITKSPKADKVKKHLKEELEADSGSSLKSPKTKMSKIKDFESNMEGSQHQNENTPKKKKNPKSDLIKTDKVAESEDINSSNDNIMNNSPNIIKNKKKKIKILNSTLKVDKSLINNYGNENDKEIKNDDEKENTLSRQQTLPPISPKKKNKLKNLKDSGSDEKSQIENNDQEAHSDNQVDNPKKSLNSESIKDQKKNRKRKNKSKAKNSNNQNTEMDADQKEKESNVENNEIASKKKKKGKKEIYVNPNAITNKDTDSEHESDNEIESENEESNKEVLDTGPAEESSDDEEKLPEKKETVPNNKEPIAETEEQIKRTLFVGNVPFSAKCKKEIKKIFSKYGQIETVRIRTVPVKDGRVTPKLAVIKNELHPDRSTVNVYVKFRDALSVKEALAENGTVLNDHHLRVTRSDSTGSEHDPKCSIFIGNLPFALEDEALHQKFQQCGEIESVRIIRDKKTNAGKGFGYVNFKSKDAVELALALTEEALTIKNRIIRVKRCTQITHKQKAQQDNRRANFQGNNRGNIQRNTREQGNFRSGQQRNFRGNVKSYGNNGQRQFENRQSKPNDNKEDGAYRRLMNKRRNQDDGTDGPQNKRQRNMSNPGKKTRKEFVGMTAEKKKKHKIAKGQKKKKAISEILTKQ